VAKPEWGTKRTCLNCAVRFYDLGKKPITCPACESSFEPEAFVKTRRSRQSAPIEPKKPAPTPQAAAPEAKAGEAEAASPDAENSAVVDNDDATLGDDAGEDDDAVLPVAADADDTKEDVAELVDKPGDTKGDS
jgi:uncharacterized protein (TIGR02300 family)